MNSGYVVIYDLYPEGAEIGTDEVEETYYGFFDTLKEAEARFKDMAGDSSRYQSVHICRIVKEVT